MTELLTENQQKIKEVISKLNSLLNDPQPGMFTWNQFYYERIIELEHLIKNDLRNKG